MEGKGMLVLTRKLGEGIAIGDDIKVVIMQIKGKQVRLGIKADPTTIVHREEIYQKIQSENKLAAGAEKTSVESVNSLIGGKIEKRSNNTILFKQKNRTAK